VNHFLGLMLMPPFFKDWRFFIFKPLCVTGVRKTHICLVMTVVMIVMFFLAKTFAELFCEHDNATSNDIFNSLNNVFHSELILP